MVTIRDGTESVRLGVVTVSYGSESVLPGFLSSVATATIHECITVVADNRPEVQGVQALTEAVGATYLAMERNVGYGGAMNAGAAALPNAVRWVLLSNPDAVLSPGAIDRLVEIGESDDRIGAVGPAILNSDGTLYPSAREVPSLRTGIGHAMLSGVWPRNPWTRKYLQHAALPAPRDTGWLSGSCLLVRRSAFNELGGFDPEFFMYFEDVDLGYRLGKHGYRNVYEPSVKVVHAGAHSTTRESARMIAAHHASARRFLKKKYPGAALWPVRALLGVGLAVRSRVVARRSSE